MTGGGFCQACAGFYALRKDGKVRNHNRLEQRGGMYGRDYVVRCPGSRREPQEIDGQKVFTR